MTWTQMPGIWQQLRGAFTANSGFPDVTWFGADPGREFIKAGWIAEMSEGINWANVEPWAKKAVTYPGPDGKPGVWAIVEHASTDEVHYNRAMFKELGIAVPARGQFSTEEFKAVVKKVVDSGKSGFANAVGDRNYPGTFITNYALLDKLGPEELVKLWKGETAWRDPRVLEALKFHEELVKLKAYPSTFASMTLSESHNYFHTQRKAAMFPIPSWYTARAFVPPEKGGQPKDFELGFLSYPHFADGKGKDTRYLAVGGAQTVAARGKNVDLAKELLNGYTSTDFANEWASLAALRTATKTDPAKIKSLFPDYWKDYYASHDGVNDLAGLGAGEHMKPGLADAYTQVLNAGLPGGLLTAEQAADKMEEARQKNQRARSPRRPPAPRPGAGAGRRGDRSRCSWRRRPASTSASPPTRSC
jgi:ABC-type glycerol-3-phosphate transport system substrate-binding protein